jgi:hypothetical protein
VNFDFGPFPFFIRFSISVDDPTGELLQSFGEANFSVDFCFVFRVRLDLNSAALTLIWLWRLYSSSLQEGSDAKAPILFRNMSIFSKQFLTVLALLKEVVKHDCCGKLPCDCSSERVLSVPPKCSELCSRNLFRESKWFALLNMTAADGKARFYPKLLDANKTNLKLVIGIQKVAGIRSC